MKNENIILFSSDDWGWKTSKYQLATRFCNQNKVLFVSSIGFRKPTASRQDLGRIFGKLKLFFKGVTKIRENLYVLTPLAIPLHKYRFVSWLNGILIRAQLKWARLRLGMRDPFIFLFAQNWYEFVRNLPRGRMLYYCIDEHSAFSGANGESLQKLNRVTSENADIVFCSSKSLTLKQKKLNPNTFHISHGVNYALFSRVVFDPNLQSAPELADIPRPILGFWGHISYDWVDAGLLKYLAEKRPQWIFLLIGRNSMEPDEFENYKNIRLVGEKNFEDLPSYCKAIDVGLIPFVKSPLTDNCNPLKLYEYLAAGLPVVSTDIPEVRFWKDSVLIAKERENFLESCEMAMKLNSKEWKEKTSLSMKSNTWDQKVKDIYQIIQKESAFHK